MLRAGNSSADEVYILCGVCLYYHIYAVCYKPEPMPHNILFCSAYGGFFILSLSGVLVPASGQVTPPGVDLVFSACAFIMFYCAALVAMYYVTIDEHLKYSESDDSQERAHPFFIHCRTHCIMSFVTATFYLMHASFSADRLLTVKMGISEEEADKEKQKPDVFSYNMAGVPIVDIPPGTPITLYLFFIDWLMAAFNKQCKQWTKKLCCEWQCCNYITQRHARTAQERKRAEIRITPHQRAALLAQVEAERKERMKRMTISKKLQRKASKADARMYKHLAKPTTATVSTAWESTSSNAVDQIQIPPEQPVEKKKGWFGRS